MHELWLLLKTLSPARIANLLLSVLSIFFSRLFQKIIVWNQPWAATIEPSAICQLSCPECPVGMKQLSRNEKLMQPATFDKILGNLCPKTFYLNLYFQGEPLLDADIFRKIELARAKKMFVLLSTNAQAIDSNSASQIVDSGLSKVVVSLDGINQETYEKYRVGGSFEKTISAIKLLNSVKKKLGSKTPIIEVQMLVFSFNEHQLQELKQIATKAGADKVVYKAAQFYNAENAAKWLPKNSKYSRYQRIESNSIELSHKAPRICKRLWQTLVVETDGRVVPCCYDKLSEFSVGNVSETKADIIWKGEKMTLFRKSLLKREAPSMCENCN
jgi:radical SAM protein with 4Fe4S-binding SPASM domain